MNVYTTMESPVGELLLVGRPSPGGVTLTSVSMAGQRFAPAVRDGWRRDPAAFAEVTRQLTEYFAGERRVFSLDLAPRGTEFQQRVWQGLDSRRGTQAAVARARGRAPGGLMVITADWQAC